MAFCSACGAQIADGSTMCAACSSRSAASSGAQVGGLTENVAGALAYLVITAIVFLVQEPYNKNKFVRFHSFQALFYCVACIVVSFALGIVAMIPFLGFLIAPLIGLGLFLVWFILLLKSYQGQKFKLPIIGDMAEKQANAP